MNITTDVKKRIHLISGIIISVMLVVTGVLFCTACYSVYKSAESQMYTYESIGKAFSKIAVPVWICIGLVIVGFVLKLALPLEKERVKANVSQAKTLKRLSTRIDIDSLPEELASEIIWKRTLRTVLCIITGAIYILRLVHTLVYVLTPENFPQNDITAEVAKASIVILFNLLIPFIVTIIVMLINRALVKSELVLVKKAIAEYPPVNPKENTEKSVLSKARDFFENSKTVLTLRILFLTLGVAFVIAGTINGGVNDVLTKAAEICAECIGLG